MNELIAGEDIQIGRMVIIKDGKLYKAEFETDTNEQQLKDAETLMSIRPTKIMVVGDTDGSMMESAKRILNTAKKIS